MNIKKTLKTMQGMFVNLKNIKSIKFLPGFDSSQVTNMNLMYAVTLFDSIDMKYLNTSNLLSLKDFLEASYSLSSLDISNFNTSKTYNMRGMFYGKNKLKEIDLSSFDTSKVSDCLIMFHDLQTNCTIKISNKFTKCREQISFDNKIINVDDLNCNKFENCEKCGGSKETLICIKCKTNYELINNRQIHDNELYNIDSKINGLSKNVEKLQVENTELRQDNEKQRNSINMLISERDMYKEKFEDQKYKNDLLNKKIFEVENGFNEMMKRKEYERNSKRQKEEYHKNKNETKTKIAQELQSKIQKYRRERLNNRNYEDLD
jgi:surface protein